MYIISEPPVSPDLYAVHFFTKDGYIPGIINVKRSEQVKTDYSIVMKKTQKRNTGFVAGVIYQPIRGGKINSKAEFMASEREDACGWKRRWCYRSPAISRVILF